MRGALLVGIDQYSFGQLDGCVNDATRLGTLLAEHESGDRNFEVRCLTSGGNKQINKTYIEEEIDRLFSAEGDVALFYFSGHGTVSKSGGFIVSQDAVKYSEGVSMTNILTYANNSKAREKIIILDCCYSGKLADGKPAENISSLSPGVCILTASRDDQVAIQNNGLSLFTSLLLSALEGGAADVLGKVTTPGIYAYIESILGFFDQRPMFKANLSGLFSIRNCKPVIERTILKKLKDYFPDKDYLYKLDPSYEKTSPDPDPNNVEVMTNLQKLRASGLVEPIPPTLHLYYAALQNEPCRLTRLGKYYWYLSRESKI